MDRIANLTPEQAQRSLLNLFELLPEGWWQDGKPTPFDIKELAGEAPEYIAALENQDEAARGELAREILRRFADVDACPPTGGRSDWEISGSPTCAAAALDCPNVNCPHGSYCSYTTTI